MASLNHINNILVYTYFSIGLALEAWVVYRVRMRLDPSMIVITASYILSYCLRFPQLSNDGAGLNLATTVSISITYFLLYYFIFEMRRMVDQLRSENFEEHLALRKRSQRVACAVYFLFFARIALSVVIMVFDEYYAEQFQEHLALFDGLRILRGAVRLIVDLFMVY